MDVSYLISDRAVSASVEKLRQFHQAMLSGRQKCSLVTGKNKFQNLSYSLLRQNKHPEDQQNDTK